MREIKFRAWDKNHNRMVYEWDKSSPYHYNRSNGYIIDNFEDEDIMQFTRNTDKNWKEIYVGDIVKFQCYGKSILKDWTTKLKKNWCKYGKVIQDANWSFIVDFGCNRSTVDNDAKELEIVWNIYENPDLIPPK